MSQRCSQDVLSVTVSCLPKRKISRLPKCLGRQEIYDLEKPFSNYNKRNSNNNLKDEY